MKRTALMFVLMCIGGCALDSEGIAQLVAVAMVLLPMIVLAWNPLRQLWKVQRTQHIDENVLLDYATRNDMVEFV
jgi:energy-coupling factor transporter transmembrane protein EcfT